MLAMTTILGSDRMLAKVTILKLGHTSAKAMKIALDMQLVNHLDLQLVQASALMMGPMLVKVVMSGRMLVQSMDMM